MKELSYRRKRYWSSGKVACVWKVAWKFWNLNCDKNGKTVFALQRTLQKGLQIRWYCRQISNSPLAIKLISHEDWTSNVFQTFKEQDNIAWSRSQTSNRFIHINPCLKDLNQFSSNKKYDPLLLKLRTRTKFPTNYVQ